MQSSLTRMGVVSPGGHYAARVVPATRPSVAAALLRVWDAPWSSTAKRFAYHALRTAFDRGLDVLEAL